MREGTQKRTRYGSEESVAEEDLMVGVLGVLTGILAILSPVAIVFIIFGFRHLRYVQRQRTIRMAFEKGLDLSPLLTEGAARPGEPRKYVLLGLLWGLPGIVIGVGVTLAAIQHGARDLTIIGWIPAAIGAAYLIFYKFVAAPDGDAGKPEGISRAPRSSGAPTTHPSRTE
jgi:hypothetical protein